MVTALGDSPPPGANQVFKSMDRLYAHLADVRKRGGISNVTFDPTDGHILNCYVDPFLQMADDEVGYMISDFKVQWACVVILMRSALDIGATFLAG